MRALLRPVRIHGRSVNQVEVWRERSGEARPNNLTKIDLVNVRARYTRIIHCRQRATGARLHHHHQQCELTLTNTPSHIQQPKRIIMDDTT